VAQSFADPGRRHRRYPPVVTRSRSSTVALTPAARSRTAAASMSQGAACLTRLLGAGFVRRRPRPPGHHRRAPTRSPRSARRRCVVVGGEGDRHAPVLLEIEIRPEAALCTLMVKSAGDIGLPWRHIWSSSSIIVAASPIEEPITVGTVAGRRPHPPWPRRDVGHARRSRTLARRRLIRSSDLPRSCPPGLQSHPTRAASEDSQASQAETGDRDRRRWCHGAPTRTLTLLPRTRTSC